MEPSAFLLRTPKQLPLAGKWREKRVQMSIVPLEHRVMALLDEQAREGRYSRFFLRPPFSKQSNAVWNSGVGPRSLSRNSGCLRGCPIERMETVRDHECVRRTGHARAFNDDDARAPNSARFQRKEFYDR